MLYSCLLGKELSGAVGCVLHLRPFERQFKKSTVLVGEISAYGSHELIGKLVATLFLVELGWSKC